MNYDEIIEKVALLTSASYELEAAYVENGGEITDETEALEALVENTRSLLEGDGIDALGEWLKGLEDRKASLKAEKDFVDRRIKATDNTIAFVKGTLSKVLNAIGKEKVKGSRGYSFTRTESRKTSVLTDDLDAAYLDLATEAVRNAGLPGFIDVALKTNGTRIADWAETHDGEGAAFVTVSETPTVTFRKPKAAKKEDE